MLDFVKPDNNVCNTVISKILLDIQQKSLIEPEPGHCQVLWIRLGPVTNPTTRAATAPAETVMIRVSRLKRTTLASTVGLSGLWEIPWKRLFWCFFHLRRFPPRPPPRFSTRPMSSSPPALTCGTIIKTSLQNKTMTHDWKWSDGGGSSQCSTFDDENDEFLFTFDLVDNRAQPLPSGRLGWDRSRSAARVTTRWNGLRIIVHVFVINFPTLPTTATRAWSWEPAGMLSECQETSSGSRDKVLLVGPKHNMGPMYQVES